MKFHVCFVLIVLVNLWFTPEEVYPFFKYTMCSPNREQIKEQEISQIWGKRTQQESKITSKQKDRSR